VRHHLEGIETLSRNPCSLCGTFKLEEDHVGSGCCSARCYDEKGRLEADPFPPYEDTKVGWYSARSDLYVGPPADVQLKAGDRIEFDGTYIRAGGKGWKEAPIGIRAAIKEGWLHAVPPEEPESIDDIAKRIDEALNYDY
jgi:hypothetical protein